MSHPDQAGLRRIERVRHELQIRDVTVRRISTISPNLLAITFGGETLAGFPSRSFDDHIKFVFTGRDGQQVRRDYTPRHFDAARLELTLEFALHDGGEASDWARGASVGDAAVIAGPKGSMVIPMDYDWHLLAGDLTALPAVHRRLEELPAGSRVQVLMLAPDAADHRPLSPRAEVAVQWVSSPEAWLAALAETTRPEGEGFVWCAGEAHLMAQARELLLPRHPREAMRVAAYWKQGAADFHERLEG